MKFLRALFLSIFPALFLFVLLYAAYQKPEVLGISIEKNVIAKAPTPLPTSPDIPALRPRGIPARLIIPSLYIDAAIHAVGVGKTGVMEVPATIADVGWYSLGSRPGNNGSAVLSGHVDGKNGEPGIFADLHALRAGDSITIEDENGVNTLFTVREIRTYDPAADASEVFYREDGIRLNLITCEGTWDAAKNSYSKRLVVFADGAYKRDN